MRVTRIEIFGFKSFVDRFVLQFDKDVIGVVGPNGCGKSNIVDSLRWVLGETHARHLRGNVLEDLIFNGTQSRRPLGMAEVSITIRPGREFSPQSLALLKPEEEQGAESVNGSVAEIPQVATEEPSGLLDIPGLFQAAEIQLTRRLYRSGESEYFINKVPCRLRDMIDLYRIIGLGARGLSIVEQGQIGDIVSKKPLERRELLEEAAGISGFRARLEVAERKLGRTADNLARLGDIKIEVERQVRSLARQAKRARERGELKERLKRLDFVVFSKRMAAIEERRADLVHRLGQLAESESRIESRFAESSAQQEEYRATVEAYDAKLADFRQAKDVVVARLNQHLAHENRLRVEAVELEGRVRLVRNAAEQSVRRREALRIEKEKITAELVTLAESEQQLTLKREESERNLQRLIENAVAGSPAVAEELSHQIDELTESVAEIPAVSEALAAAEREVRSELGKLQDARRAVNGKEISVAGLRAEVLSLEAQLKTLARHVAENTAPVSSPEKYDEKQSGDVELLFAGLSVPSDLQRAVSAVLGERFRYAVAEDCRDRAVRYEQRKESRQQGAKSAQLGILDRSFRCSTNLQPLTETEKERAPSAASLLGMLDISESVEELVREFLGNVFLVSTLEEGFALVHGEETRTRIAVTRGGDVVAPWGWFTTAGDGAELAFRRVLSEKQGVLTSAEAELSALTTSLRHAEEGVQAAEQKRHQANARRESLLDMERKLSSLLRQRELQEREEREKALRVEREAGESLRRVSTELASVTRTLALQRRRSEELAAEIEQTEVETEKLRGDISDRERDHESKVRELDAVGRVGEGSGDEESVLVKLRQEVAELERGEEDIYVERNKYRVEFAELEHTLAEARREKDSISRDRHEALLGQDRCRLETEMLHEEMTRLYGSAEVPFAEDEENIELEEAQREAVALRSRIEREGEVDPESITMYETEKTRLEDLEKQTADLTSAIAILERTIRQLKEISRERFLETFNFVSKKFAELVPRLYGGGSGVLELINPEDPLMSGIELSVRPPGKKLRTIELLSGGEKALAATAVLMSMFLHRPSPICVLDEVDAPLDDANLERFLDLIREISHSTQFLIITHNKQTMMAADRLVGITMEERGVSKALSVSLDEAVEELERQAANA